MLTGKVQRRERELETFNHESEGDMPRSLVELHKLRKVSYGEIIELARYLTEHSVFQTKHGVKGEEFENVLVVVGRGWNQYDFGAMLAMAGTGSVPAAKNEMFIRSRNLFYVACSRPRTNLAVLFTQFLSDSSMQTILMWFGQDAVEEVTL